MPDANKKLAALEKRANGGEARAQYELGLAYYRGEGVEKDMPTARLWLRKAADQGDRDAAVLLNLRGMQLNQGVEFKFGGSQPPIAKAPTQEPVEERHVYTSQQITVRSADELKQGLREAVAETQQLVPDPEPLKDRILVGLNSMLKCIESRRIPEKSARGMMTLRSVMEQGLRRYEGVRFAAYKKRVIELGQWFETIDLAPPTIVKPLKSVPGGDKHAQVASIADQIEAELRSLGWWSETPLTAEQLDFKAAFGMDTMPFAAWIQFILLPRVRSIVEERGSFPGRSMVGAHAVREFDGLHEASRLASLLSLFDQTVEGG